jgi:molecular chaperone Hsp33
MNDTVQRFLFEHLPVRGEVVQLAASWRAVVDRHRLPPPLRSVLGELMAAATLLAATLKFEGTITLQMHGNGPVSLIVVECSNGEALRATAKWREEAGLDLLPASPPPLHKLLGEGRFVISLVPANGQQAYQGVVDLAGETVAAVLEHYMSTSEQVETRLWLASDESRCGGLLLQKLPERESTVDPDGWTRLCHLAGTVTADELCRLDVRTLLHRLFHEDDVRLFEPRPVFFRCSCTRERVAGMLRLLGPEEVRSVLAERGEVEVHCEFCNRRYAFDAVDGEALFAQGVVLPGDPAPQ